MALHPLLGTLPLRTVLKVCPYTAIRTLRCGTTLLFISGLHSVSAILCSTLGSYDILTVVSDDGQVCIFHGVAG